MTHLNRSAAIAALMAVCAGGGISGQAQMPSFRARADAVAISVAVHQRGRPVTGLAIADFDVFDEGVPQQITRMEYETLPIDVTVLLDVSDSVAGYVLESLRRSIRELVRDLPAQDRFSLVTFNMRISRALDFGAGRGALDPILNGIRAFGGTSVRDALAVTLTRPVMPGRRQLVIAFTDGEDLSSITDADKLFEVVRRTTPTIALVFPSFAAVAGDAAMSAPEGARAKLYADLAAETGGFVDFARSDQSLRGSFRRLLADFRRSYVLYFTPSGARTPGTRSLDVRVKREGVDVRARRSYTVF